jgi:hypothetical protein
MALVFYPFIRPLYAISYDVPPCVSESPYWKIFDLTLSCCPAKNLGNRHGPCVMRFMARAKKKSADVKAHYGFNSGEVVFSQAAVMRKCSSLSGNYNPPLTAYEYRGYIISAWARPKLTNGCTSVGVVYERGQFRSPIQLQRIEGELFDTKEHAEEHGLELCKEWIDNTLDAPTNATLQVVWRRK